MPLLRLISWIFRKRQTSRLEQVLRQLDQAIERFRTAAEMTVHPHSRLFWDLAAASVELRSQIVTAPENIGSLRRFLFFFLPKMSELCCRWAQIAHAEPLQAADETAIRDFQGYLAIIRTATDASRSRRYDDLHLSMEAFDEQLRRRSP